MLSLDRLNAYRIMWIFVLFDLPTTSSDEKKLHTRFRNDILKAGFTRLQYSIYVRPCPSKEFGTKYINGIKKIIPAKGRVDILMITDKQYGAMISFFGKKKKKVDTSAGDQLELF